MNIIKTVPDLKIAGILLNDDASTPYDHDMAGYHVQQAIEKCLKYYLSNIYHEDETLRQFRTHSIGTLIAKCYSHGMGNDDFPDGLIEMSEEITKWESGARYGQETVCNAEEVRKALGIAEKMYAGILELEQTRAGDAGHEAGDDKDDSSNCITKGQESEERGMEDDVYAEEAPAEQQPPSLEEAIIDCAEEAEAENMLNASPEAWKTHAQQEPGDSWAVEPPHI